MGRPKREAAMSDEAWEYWVTQHVVGGLTTREIAKHLGCTCSAVWQQIAKRGRWERIWVPRQ